MFLVFVLSHTATTDIYTISLHDSLPIWFPKDREMPVPSSRLPISSQNGLIAPVFRLSPARSGMYDLSPPVPPNDSRFADRKSTRLNSSHYLISYAVFCLKKKIHTCIWTL